MKLNVTGSM